MAVSGLAMISSGNKFFDRTKTKLGIESNELERILLKEEFTLIYSNNIKLEIQKILDKKSKVLIFKK